MMMRSSVVLPQPDWPMMPTTAPRGIARSMSRSTGRARVVAEGNVLDFNDLRLLHGVILSQHGGAPPLNRDRARCVKRYGATPRRWPASTSRSRAGEAFGLVGANGAGKTTLIKCLLDLCALDAGSDRDLRRRRRAIPRRGAGSPSCPSASSRRYYLRGREFLAMHAASCRRRATTRARALRDARRARARPRRARAAGAQPVEGHDAEARPRRLLPAAARSLRARRADERP